jgi:HEAT repeat protein
LSNLFGGSRAERERKRIKELSRRAQEKYGDPAARTRALEQLRDIGTPEAIAALLQRFTVKTEPGITDTEEREFTLSIVTSFGDAAVGPVEEFIRTQENVAWGLRCLEQLVSEERRIGVVVEVLEKLAREYTREPDKKVLLINHLADTRDPRIAPAVERFLDDPSDDVRIAALQTLVAQGATDARDRIAACLIEAEAPRVRAAAADALARLGVPVEARREELQSRLPPGFALDAQGVVVARS